MPEKIYDATDLAILMALQEDGRIPNVDLAEKVNLSPSSCLRRTKALEADGLIAGYRAELDREVAGLTLTVFVSLKVNQHSRERSRQIEAALLAIPAVVACYLVSGEADFLVELAVTGLPEYERVLLDHIVSIDAVADARSTFVLRSAQSRGPLPVSQLRRRG